jgi:hypothetical protein
VWAGERGNDEYQGEKNSNKLTFGCSVIKAILYVVRTKNWLA